MVIGAATPSNAALKKMMSPREELMRDFHDKVAFVTGGASGLGLCPGARVWSCANESDVSRYRC